MQARYQIVHYSQHPPVIILFCHRIPSTSFVMRLFTSSGWSVLELCPASLIHSKGMPVLLCHALLYLTHEPALSYSPQISKAGHLISYARFLSTASASILYPCPATFAYLFWSPSYTNIISRISFLPYSVIAIPSVPAFKRDFHG